ncbi:MAG: nitroreductase family protein [Actinobacteria bacterium]|nr:nitroreductase family protein [Actinomycetota bacterium]
MDVFDAIRNRRSHRAYQSDPVEPEKIDQILEAAHWAPSPANGQPWEFIIVTDGDARGHLVDLSEEARKSGNIELHGFSYIRPIPQAQAVETEVDPANRYSLSFLKDVPVIIAVVGDPNPPISQVGPGRVQDGYKYACAAAIQNMLLAAQALGLASLWFTFFDRELVSRFLNVNPGKHLLALVCLGYAAGEPPTPSRISLNSKVRRFEP